MRSKRCIAESEYVLRFVVCAPDVLICARFPKFSSSPARAEETSLQSARRVARSLWRRSPFFSCSPRLCPALPCHALHCPCHAPCMLPCPMLYAPCCYAHAHAPATDAPRCMCVTSPTPAFCTLAASLQYNNLDNDAKRLLQDANRKRSTPAILERARGTTGLPLHIYLFIYMFDNVCIDS
jgi:hypothetical protein